MSWALLEQPSFFLGKSVPVSVAPALNAAGPRRGLARVRALGVARALGWEPALSSVPSLPLASKLEQRDSSDWQSLHRMVSVPLPPALFLLHSHHPPTRLVFGPFFFVVWGYSDGPGQSLFC